jgi:hypothetical protein
VTPIDARDLSIAPSTRLMLLLPSSRCAQVLRGLHLHP